MPDSKVALCFVLQYLNFLQWPVGNSMFKRILFVCTGNICRSPMAEGLFKHYLETIHVNIDVSSAGLAAVVNKPATSSAQSLLRMRDIDISSHRARQLTRPMTLDAELILVMEISQKKQLERLYPYTLGKVFLLGKWGNFEVPDPYGGMLSDYENVLKLIDDGLYDWQKKICNV